MKLLTGCSLSVGVGATEIMLSTESLLTEAKTVDIGPLLLAADV